MKWVYKLYAVLKYKLYFVFEPVKFISWYDLPKDSFSKIRIMNGYVWPSSKKREFTYQDKDVLQLNNCSFFVNNSYAITNQNEWITGTGYAESLYYRITQRKLNSKSKLTLTAENATCLGDFPYDNYSHLLLDTLPRIFSLYHAELTKINKLEVFVPYNLSKEYIELMKYLIPKNCELRVVDRNLNTKVTANTYYHLPYFTENSKGYLPSDVLSFLKDKLTQYFAITQKSNKRRIYISRQDASKRKFTDEQPILQLLKDYGFETVQLEKYSIQEQIELFANIDMVIGIHGAGFTNLLWSKPCSVIEIFPSANHNAWQYEYLAEACGHNYYKIEFGGHKLNDAIILTPSKVNELELLIQKCVG